jgi:hypothetical protein
MWFLIIPAAGLAYFFWPVIKADLNFKRKSEVAAQASYIQQIVPSLSHEYLMATPARRKVIVADILSHNFMPFNPNDPDSIMRWAQSANGLPVTGIQKS